MSINIHFRSAGSQYIDDVIEYSLNAYGNGSTILKIVYESGERYYNFSDILYIDVDGLRGTIEL